MADSPQCTHAPPVGNLPRRAFLGGLFAAGAAVALAAPSPRQASRREELVELIALLPEEDVRTLLCVARAAALQVTA